MAESLFLGLDIGTSGVKAILVAGDGDVVAAATHATHALDATARLGRAASRTTGGARRSSRSATCSPQTTDWRCCVSRDLRSDALVGVPRSSRRSR